MRKLDRARWQTVTPLLEELLDASEPQRAARLAQIDAQDPLLAADLASLLAIRAQVETEGFLEATALDHLGGESTLAGKTLGSYMLEREIGAGGMGTVWLAHRTDGRYEGRVAVKLLNLGLLGRGGAERFRREGNALARLTHPNVSHLLDAGDIDGHPYLVIEYVEGQPVDVWCDSHALAVDARIGLFLQVLSAVGYAHSQLILHRDLKPSNILVTCEGQVKLLDFGIAKLLGDESLPAARTELTQIAGRALTLDYAAPEQVQGADVSTATDVYALGVLLFQLLVGAHPTARASMTHIERLRAVTEDEPQRLSNVALASTPAVAMARATTAQRLARALRGDLDNIVAKALRKAPAERYGTVEALADDLCRFLSHQPVNARPDSTGYRLTKFVRRNRVAVTAASAAAGILVAISTVATWQMVEAHQQRHAAEQEAERAASARDFLHFVLTEAGASNRPYTVQELLVQAERSLESKYGSPENPLAIEELAQIGELYSTLGQQVKALEVAQTAYRRATNAGYHDQARSAACSIGKQLHMAGKLKEAADLLDRTVTELRASATAQWALVGCLQFRADLALALGETGSAVALAKEAVALTNRAELRTPASGQIAPRMQLAIAYRVAGESKLADSVYRQVQDLFRRLGRERTVDAVIAASNWGKLRSDVGDILGAARLIESALAAWQAVRPGDAGDYVMAINYAQRLLTLLRLDEAQRYFSEARQGAATQNDPEMEFLAMLGLAAVQRERGEFAAARDALEAAGEFIRRNFPSPEHRAHTALLMETGRLHLAGGAFAEARAALSEVAAKRAAAKVRDPARALTLATLAEVEQALGNSEPAAALATQATEIAEQLALPGEPSYWVGHCLLVRAEIEKAAGRGETARRLGAQALAQLEPTVGADHPSTRKANTFARN